MQHQGDYMQNRVFIVDDNPANTTMLSQLIEGEGFGSMMVFNDPEEALAEFYRLKPNLILLDLLMPKISGLEFLKHIEPQVKNAEVAVIVLTASQSEESKITALSIGVQDYITKPFNMVETLQRIHNVFNLQRHKNSFQHLSEDLGCKLEKARADLADVILTLNAVFKDSSEYVFVTDSSGDIIDCNASASKCFAIESLTGNAEEHNLFRRFSINGWATMANEAELTLIDGNGKLIIVQTSYSKVVINATEHFIFIFKDITTLKEDEVNLRYLSETHYITHLPNRNQLQRMVMCKSSCLDKRACLSFIFISFTDNTKAIGLFGCERMAFLLLNVALILVDLAEKNGSILLHWGDNDFLLVDDAVKTNELVAQIQQRFNQPIKLSDNGDQAAYSKPTLGVCISDEVGRVDPSNYEKLVHNALLATYEGSRTNCKLTIYDQQLHRKISYQALIEKELLSAISTDGFKVAYQPKIDLETGKVVGVEALVRWFHQALGIIRPDVFIPIAESAGLINDIGAMVLTKVFEDVALLKRTYTDLQHVAVNVAAPQLDEHFIALLQRCISQPSACSSDFIELEITETSFLNDFERVNPILKKIKAMGFRLAIDDFGTGYSSLSYLHELPIDTLKIDRSFVIHVCESNKSLLMVKSIISMSLALGLEIVAEGIEDEQTGLLLRELGVHKGQGYYYYKPTFLS
ncbi:MAG: EAL domain-containing protein (putative c-di-GMP-specific phosphodiesterase class I) [Alteromonadaceae bacterium]|jgi:EAL domain-containing protein (putative c-di-GMP-specific phosphodiesterase class I)/DNA-binding response OmpR family regulator/GGDEF domain-containing protein